MAAKAVVVFNQTGQPVREAEVLLEDTILGLTNSDGYVLSPRPGFPGQTYVRVLASGYSPAVYAITLDDHDQEIHLGGPNSGGNTIFLPAISKSFSKPSRDRIINVKANLCNIYDADGIPIFEPFIDWLIVNGDPKADDWVQRLKDAGSTHLSITLTGDYPAPLAWNGYHRYPIPGMDNTKDLSTFSSIIDWVKSRNLIPIIKLGFDGQHYDPNGWTYGWQYGMDNMARIANGLSNHIDSVLWSTGFDGCFADWSPQQTIEMLRNMRIMLGKNACIDTEFNGPGAWGYIHLGQGAADWTPDKLGILDHFSLEAESWPPDTGEPIQEIATRLLGPNCLIGPQTPYYLQGIEKTIAIDVYETWATKFIRKECTPQDAINTANQCKKYGFTSFGNGIPNE